MSDYSIVTTGIEITVLCVTEGRGIGHYPTGIDLVLYWTYLVSDHVSRNRHLSLPLYGVIA